MDVSNDLIFFNMQRKKNHKFYSSLINNLSTSFLKSSNSKE